MLSRKSFNPLAWVNRFICWEFLFIYNLISLWNYYVFLHHLIALISKFLLPYVILGFFRKLLKILTFDTWYYNLLIFFHIFWHYSIPFTADLWCFFFALSPSPSFFLICTACTTTYIFCARRRLNLHIYICTFIFLFAIIRI